MFYLNTLAPFTAFEKIVKNDIYIDKTLMIQTVSERIGKEQCYLCVTKPRRFGKSVNASMLAAYYSKGADASRLFAKKKISRKHSCTVHRNKHNVIFMTLNRYPDVCNNYQDFITYVQNHLTDDLYESYPFLKEKPCQSLSDLFFLSGDQFIFILDEWDSVFHKKFMTLEDKEAYLRFLESLLKNQPYVELAYMTGVLPVARYSSGSALNMFAQYGFINDPKFDTFFGFTEDEVLELCQKYSAPSYEAIKYWYDGYYTNDGKPLFNPRSVTQAFTDGVCGNYWTETGPMNEIEECIRHNVDAVRDDIVALAAGNPVRIKLNGYSASDQSLTERNEILSAMVVYGFLSYHNQTLRIPNHELMDKFNQVLNRKTMGVVADIVERSRDVFEATLRCDAERVAVLLEDVHDREIPFLQYNDENSLSCVVTLCYLYARDFYQIEREEKSGKGYCDYLFIPYNKDDPAIVLELKYGKSAEEAIQQIKTKNYIQKVEDFSKILFVGINYNKEADKHHECIIEQII